MKARYNGPVLFIRKNLLSVLDAKYKSTAPSPEKPAGVLREDLYQLNAYLSAFADRDRTLIGGLVYPAEEGTNIGSLQRANPWRTTGTGLPFHFFGVATQKDAAPNQLLTAGEADFIAAVDSLIADVHP